MVQSFGMFPLNQGEGLWVSYDKDGAAIAQQMKTAIEQTNLVFRLRRLHWDERN